LLVVFKTTCGRISFSREGLLPKIRDSFVTLVHAFEDLTVESGLEVVGGAVISGHDLLTRFGEIVLDDLKPTSVFFANTITESFLASPAKILRQVALKSPT
jgi:hypothetical protein